MRTAPPTSPAPSRSARRRAEMRQNFTLRAQGPYRHRARGVSGRHHAARSSIRWRGSFCGRRGLDFDHGTGHGVGSYLSVHEGPARISKLGTAPLKRGMILSNEPGYYRTGAYGIRIENLILVTEAPPVAGCREAAQCLRNADAGADRHAADRAGHADRRGDRLARRLSRPRARTHCPVRRFIDPRLVARRDDPARAPLETARQSRSGGAAPTTPQN